MAGQQSRQGVDIAAVFAAVAPRAKDNYRSGFALSADVFAQFHLAGPLRVAHFLAQMLEETGGGEVLFENLDYATPARLSQVFGVGHHSAAITPGEIAHLLHNPVALADRVYGLGNPAKAHDLGNVAPGDGFKYRGGGALQTTGRTAYRVMGGRIGVDLEGDPTRIVDPAHIVLPALHAWRDAHLNDAADANDIRRITLAINGGLNGLDARRAWFGKVWPIASGGQPPPAFDD